MMKSLRPSPSALPKLMLFLNMCTQVAAALIISVPARGVPLGTMVDRETFASRETATKLSFRLRSTREQDLNSIASLLASADTDDTKMNWKMSMNLLRHQASLYNVLSHRFKAIEEAKKAVENLTFDACEAERLRLLWSNDNFRSRLEKAVTIAKEPHVLGHHKFATCPENADVLRHIMITAEDRLTDKVVGFCEISMMTHHSAQKPRDCVSYAPTIANLATLTHFRRQGIGSALLKSAERFVRQEWSHEEIALYVKRENKRAISLYSKQGFRPRAKNNSQLLMTKALHAR